ncbi:MAG TPA: DUF998 domain-containing protein [Promicromonospora sp.]|nr:DUF998 domain-containing protein [Promicromonospora sp.]
MTPATAQSPGPVAVYGAGMVVGAIFPPDPLPGFPPGQDGVVAPSASGILHLASGGVGFVAVAVAAILFGGWLVRRGERGRAVWSRVAGVVVLGGFLGGVALGSAGTAGLWLAVVVGFGWLLVASVRVYRQVPRPDGARAAA